MLKLALGMSKQQEESIQEQEKYLAKHDLATENLYQLKDHWVDSLRLNINSLDTGRYSEGFRPIQFRMYNRQGEIISSWASCYGSLEKRGYLDTFPPKPVWVLNPDLTLQQDLVMLTDRAGNDVDLSVIPADADYVMLVFWAKYMGHISRNAMIHLEEYLQQHPDENVFLMKVNVGNWEEENISVEAAVE